MTDNDLQELVARQKKYPLVAMINSSLVDGQVDLLKFSEEQIAQMEADLLLRRNADQQKQTPLNTHESTRCLHFLFHPGVVCAGLAVAFGYWCHLVGGEVPIRQGQGTAAG
jgi:hypothetical protein